MLRIDINLIFTVINVLVLCLAVRIFLWKPVHKVLAQRQAMVDASFADAEKAKTEAEALVEEQKAFRANIEGEKSAALAEARKQAQAESSRIVADAHSRADIILREAENDAQCRKEEILRQLAACQAGEITQEELKAAQEAICSSLRTIPDAPGRMEDFALFRLLSGFPLDRTGYRDAVRAVTVADAAWAARQVELDTIFFLKGAKV